MLPAWLWIIIIATVPIVELRGAIPVAIASGFQWHDAYILSVVGNLIPVPFILWLLPVVEVHLRRIPSINRFFDWLFARTRRKADAVHIYGLVGLAIFVAVPLPFTGAWTGSLAAYLFGLRKFPALISIATGVLLAGIIVIAICITGRYLWLLG